MVWYLVLTVTVADALEATMAVAEDFIVEDGACEIDEDILEVDDVDNLLDEEETTVGVKVEAFLELDGLVVVLLDKMEKGARLDVVGRTRVALDGGDIGAVTVTVTTVVVSCLLS